MLSIRLQQPGPIALDVDLNCAGSQLLALVGSSGSGKSTILRMIAGLSRPHLGHIACGSDVWLDTDTRIHLSPQQRRIGYVPQHYGLFPHMSAFDNVKAALHHLSPAEQLERTRAWISRVHLDGLENRHPAELSGGQQQRVAVARALAGDPSVLLLDEPFSAVDSATREKLHGELAELKKQLSIPIILVTHDLNEALMLADCMALISHGKSLQSGLPHELIARPANVAAAQLVGIRNLFESEVLGHGPSQSHTRLKLGPYVLESPYQAAVKEGDIVRWVIPDNGVRFRAISRTEQPFSRNQIDITISKVLTLGDEVRLTMRIDEVEAPLQASIPLRLASELELEEGRRSSVMLRADDIHILPAL